MPRKHPWGQVLVLLFLLIKYCNNMITKLAHFHLRENFPNLFFRKTWIYIIFYKSVIVTWTSIVSITTTITWTTIVHQFLFLVTITTISTLKKIYLIPFPSPFITFSTIQEMRNTITYSLTIIFLWTCLHNGLSQDLVHLEK